MAWQVTCQCGWRTRGEKDDVVAAVKAHGLTAHEQQLTTEDVLAIAQEIDQPAR